MNEVTRNFQVRKVPTVKFFEDLTDKKMLKKLTLYDFLCVKHSILGYRVYNINGIYYNQKTFNLFRQSELHYNYLKKEIVMLKSLYKNSKKVDFTKQTKHFKFFVKNWNKILKSLNFAVYKLEKEIAKKHNQKTR